MNLFYYKTKAPSSNFGDELNPWLWPRLLPFLDSGGAAKSETIFVGIGTVLNDTAPERVKKAKTVVFFSTGAGYGLSLRQRCSPNWKIYCVRGPLSAQRLKLPRSAAITDGAVLLKRFFQPVTVAERSPHFSYMPHFRHGNPQLFKAVCQRVGLKFIDPAEPVENIIADISRSRGLISEAMHGAIVADTLRVPWLPVRTSPKILPFKWKDWCASIDLSYRYRLIRGAKSLSTQDCLYPLRPYLQRQASTANLFEGVTLNRFSYPYEKTLDWIGHQLDALTQKTFYLSSDAILESRVSQLEERLEHLRQDAKAGRL
ncbi:MAG: polysaccharide pyruvyl transferase family protein [Cyanobacteria bacterium J06627_28]